MWSLSLLRAILSLRWSLGQHRSGPAWLSEVTRIAWWHKRAATDPKLGDYTPEKKTLEPETVPSYITVLFKRPLCGVYGKRASTSYGRSAGTDPAVQKWCTYTPSAPLLEAMRHLFKGIRRISKGVGWGCGPHPKALRTK